MHILYNNMDMYAYIGIVTWTYMHILCWSIEGWIHSKRRNRLHQTLVEKLVRAHTNLVLRESLDDALHHLLPWDIELIIDEPVDQTEEEPEV